MSIFDFFNKGNSASKATDRLQIVLAHERSMNVPYIEQMKSELLEVIKKYTNTNNISIKTDTNQNINMLEIEITLNEKA